MPEKVLFKTGRIHGFSNRNAADDAEAVWRSHKKKSAKNYSLDRQTTSSQIGEITGVKRNCFSNILPFSPNIVFLSLPRNLTTTLPRSLPAGEVIARSYPIRTVIQFSICPSIGRQREGAKINPLCNIFCSAYNGKKSRYTAHQISGR